MINRPRIAVLANIIPHYRVPLYGSLSRSEFWEFTIMAGLPAKGPAPRLASQTEIEEADIHVKWTKNFWLFGFLWQGFSPALAFDRRYEAIICTGDMHYLSTWIMALLARLTGKPVLFWTHGLIKPDHGVRKWLRGIWHKLPHHILTYGEVGRSLLIQAGTPAEKVSRIGNALDFDRQSSIYTMLSAAPAPARSTPIIVSVGRLLSHRRLDLLILAADILHRRGVSVEVRIIGDGPERRHLERLALETGASKRISFLGPIYSEEEVGRHLFDCDLFVVPGDLGLSAIHAHTYGAPIITCGDWEFQTPEAEVIANGQTGGYTRHGDPMSVADQIEKWLDRNADRQSTRQECRAAVAEGWTPESVRRSIELALSERLVTARRNTPHE